MDLRTLVNEARARLSETTGQRISMTEIAKRCRTGRSHMYRLMEGEAVPGDLTVRLLAAGLDVTQARVREALAATAAGPHRDPP